MLKNNLSPLAQLEAQVARDLERIAWPAVPWVKPQAGPDGAPMLDVLVVGAGQGGITVGHQLMRDRIDNFQIVDRCAPDERGPWKTFARMRTLRSVKETNGPDLDVPSLTFQTWYEAQYGTVAWDDLGLIPKDLWADYVTWMERVLDLPVRSGVSVTAVRPHASHVAVDLEDEHGARTCYARHIVLAAGIETPGRWKTPAWVDDLPADRWNHTRDAIDFAALAGKDVAVLGAGASAFDNASTALEAGAAGVHLCFRKAQMQRVQKYKGATFTGFFKHFADLDDATRWQFMNYFFSEGETVPRETWERFVLRSGSHVHGNCAWNDVSVRPDGRIKITTPTGTLVVDHLIFGTGFTIDLAADPLLGPFAERIATWGDQYTPPAGQENGRLAAYPYLRPDMSLTARAPEDARALSRIKVFSFGATASCGPSGSSINGLRQSVPRLGNGISRRCSLMARKSILPTSRPMTRRSGDPWPA